MNGNCGRGVGGQVTTRLFGMYPFIPSTTHVFFCFNTSFDAETNIGNSWNKQVKARKNLYIFPFFGPPPTQSCLFKWLGLLGTTYMKLNNYFYKLHNN